MMRRESCLFDSCSFRCFFMKILSGQSSVTNNFLVVTNSFSQSLVSNLSICRLAAFDRLFLFWWLYLLFYCFLNSFLFVFLFLFFAGSLRNIVSLDNYHSFSIIVFLLLFDVRLNIVYHSLKHQHLLRVGLRLRVLL